MGRGETGGNEETATRRAEIPSGRPAREYRPHPHARAGGEGAGGDRRTGGKFVYPVPTRADGEQSAPITSPHDSIRGGAVPSFSSSPPRDTGRAFPSLRRDRAPAAARGMRLSPVALCREIRDTLKRIRRVRGGMRQQ